jgi:cyclophilin family peptidyl-prolyl cis-trans isomerase
MEYKDDEDDNNNNNNSHNYNNLNNRVTAIESSLGDIQSHLSILINMIQTGDKVSPHKETEISKIFPVNNQRRNTETKSNRNTIFQQDLESFSNESNNPESNGSKFIIKEIYISEQQKLQISVINGKRTFAIPDIIATSKLYNAMTSSSNDKTKKLAHFISHEGLELLLSNERLLNTNIGGTGDLRLIYQYEDSIIRKMIGNLVRPSDKQSHANSIVAVVTKAHPML